MPIPYKEFTREATIDSCAVESPSSDVCLASSAIEHVLTDQQPGAMSRAPSGFLLGRLRSDPSGSSTCAQIWQAFLQYRRPPTQQCETLYSEPDVAHNLLCGVRVMCAPPFISLTRGPNVAPPSIDPKQAEFCGVILGEERREGRPFLRRWAVVIIDALECMVHLKQIQSSTMSEERSTTNFVRVMKRAMAGRKPEAAQTTWQAASSAPAGSLPLRRSPRPPRLTAKAARTLTQPSDRPSGNTCTAVVLRGSTAPASGAAPPGSGLPYGLNGVGPKKLESLEDEKLRLLLQEHGISKPPSSSNWRNWSINELLKK